MKICSNCGGDPQPIGNFNKKKKAKDGLQPWCKECNRKRSRKYYREHLEKHREVIKARKQKVVAENLAQYKAIKRRLKCSLCPEDEDICLDFHHMHGKDRRIRDGISRGWCWSRVVKEMLKCVVVCSNCHRKVHAGLKKVTKAMMWTPSKEI